MPQEDPPLPPTLSYEVAVRRRSVLPFALLAAAIHFTAFSALFWFTFHGGMSRSRTGAAPSAVEQAADIFLVVLSFPLRTIVRSLGLWRLGDLLWLIFAANSLLWGLAFSFIVSSLRRLGPRLAEKEKL